MKASFGHIFSLTQLVLKNINHYTGLDIKKTELFDKIIKNVFEEE